MHFQRSNSILDRIKSVFNNPTLGTPDAKDLLTILKAKKHNKAILWWKSPQHYQNAGSPLF